MHDTPFDTPPAEDGSAPSDVQPATAPDTAWWEPDPQSDVDLEPIAVVARRQDRVALIGTVALIVVLAFGGGFLVGRGSLPGAADGTGATTSTAPASVGLGSASTIPSTGPGLPSDGNRLGRADAKVVVDYWADFQCPYCAKFGLEFIPQLTSRIADGTVALVHRDFSFIGPESTTAAVAVRCAGEQGLYWPMHDAVYSSQAGENQGAFTRQKLVAIAGAVGVDTVKLDACLDDHAVLVAVLDDTAAGVRTGIESTPTIDVNGKRFLGVPDATKLFAAIDAAAAGRLTRPVAHGEAVERPVGRHDDQRTRGR